MRYVPPPEVEEQALEELKADLERIEEERERLDRIKEYEGIESYYRRYEP